ncbi:MAG: ATPase, T2SS/T4P/T4SS family [Candidatus Methanoperedens sp.]|nr:ATPase, T2SS/T4P/T4SS family [Candidatus Methanoperedens sp.]
MDDIRERVRGFLAEFTSPGEEDIQRFLSDIESKNPSLDIGDFKKKLRKVIEQRDELRTYEKYLPSLNADSHAYKELDSILRVAREGQKNLGDISSVLKKAGSFLETVKENNKEKKPVSVAKLPVEVPEVKQSSGAVELEEMPIEEDTEERKDTAPKEDAGEGMEKQSKKSRKKNRKDKTKKQAEEAIKIEMPEEAIKTEKPEETAAAQRITIADERPRRPEEPEKIAAQEPNVTKVQEVVPVNQEVPQPVERAPAEKALAREPEKESEVDKQSPPQPSQEVKLAVETTDEIKAEETGELKVQEKAGAQEGDSQKPQEAATKTEIQNTAVGTGAEDKGSQPQQEEGKTPPDSAEIPDLQREIGTEQNILQPTQDDKTIAGKIAEETGSPGTKEENSQKPGEEKATVVSAEAPKIQAESVTKERVSQQPEEKKVPVEETTGVKDKAAIKEDADKMPADGQSAKKEKKHKKKKDAEVPAEIKLDIGLPADKEASLEKAQDFLQRLEMDDTRDLLKDQLTPEKQAVFELLEEKMLSDVETRIKKLKEMQSNVLEEKPPQTLLGKIKTFFTKEDEAIETYDVALHGPLVTFEGMQGFNEIERYWVNEPYAFVVILFDPNNNAYLYYVAEPALSEFEDLFLKEIKDRLKDVLLVEDIKDEGDKDKTLVAKVRQLVKDYAIDITPMILEKILYYTRRDFIKFGKLDPLMHDNRIEDISANGHDIPIYLYHKKYTNIPTNIYYNENELNSYVIRLAQRCGKHISIAEPMIDATMPDGSRIQMTLGTEVTSHGATFTIRKFSEIPITPVDLINWNTFSAEAMAYLWLCIENNKSLIYAGGTASGKTSSLNAVSLFIPAQAKIVTLEDTRELKLPHPNWIPGVTRDSFTADGRGSIDMYELLRAALRQRPEFLLVGEVRGKEALTLFQAMSTGHTTFSTMHADSVASAIHRLENPPISVPRTMIQALNIISIQSQTYVGGKRARRNMKLVEITDIDPTTRNIRTNDIFVWDPLTDKFPRVGESKALNEIMIRRGWSPADLRKELIYRQKILEFMVNNKITDFNAIATIIHDYQATPEKVLTKLNITL